MIENVAELVARAAADDADARAGAVRRLIQLLDDQDAFTRSEAADALGPIGDPSAAPALQRALTDDEPVVRAAAAESLGDLGQRNSMEALTRAVRDDPDEAVRAFASSALGLLGMSDDVLSELQRKEMSDWVRAELAIARYRAGGATIDEVVQPLAAGSETQLIRVVNGLYDLVDRGAGLSATDQSVLAEALQSARSRVPAVAAEIDRLAGRLTR
ncbi:HEAT repeat domain-containing protein [Microlunatus ginsengisoli]|uniref:HEAT repeat domain-containing protein n=1 Tax=Microlunatus ginsengisoli TaxID=363863 RepID=A0ABP7ALX2_9ACTN